MVDLVTFDRSVLYLYSSNGARCIRKRSMPVLCLPACIALRPEPESSIGRWYQSHATGNAIHHQHGCRFHPRTADLRG
jgi:hypothetical protein